MNLLLAIAIGDAVGQPYEGNESIQIKKVFDITKIGKITDDTEQSIAIAEHMIANGMLSHEEYATFLYNTYNRNKIKTLGYSQRMTECLNSKTVNLFIDRLTYLSVRNSNGSVMRTLPIGLYPTVEKVLKACVIHSSLTHPSVECIFSCQIIALTVHYYYYNIKDTLYNFLSKNMSYRIRRDILDSYEEGKILCDAKQTASFCLQMFIDNEYNKMSEILYNSIIVGGDVDSTAAICLGIASVNKNIINDLDDNLYNKLDNGNFGRDYIIKLNEELYKKYPNYL